MTLNNNDDLVKFSEEYLTQIVCPGGVAKTIHFNSIRPARTTMQRLGTAYVDAVALRRQQQPSPAK